MRAVDLGGGGAGACSVLITCQVCTVHAYGMLGLTRHAAGLIMCRIRQTLHTYVTDAQSIDNSVLPL